MLRIQLAIHIDFSLIRILFLVKVTVFQIFVLELAQKSCDCEFDNWLLLFTQIFKLHK